MPWRAVVARETVRSLCRRARSFSPKALVAAAVPAARLRATRPRVHEDRRSLYGDPLGTGEGAGEPKLKFTAGGLSAPGSAVKNGRGAKPNIPAIKFVGKLRTVVL